MAILGFPKYEVTRGKIIFKGEDITHMDTQNGLNGHWRKFPKPPAIRGVKLNDLKDRKPERN